MGALIHFHDMGASVIGPNGTPLQVLTIRLEDEYKLPKASPTGQIQDWIQKYPLAWAETGQMGLAMGQPPIVVNMKSSATPVSVKQYPPSEDAYRGIRPHI